MSAAYRRGVYDRRMALCLGCGLQVDADGYPAVHVAPPLVCDNTTGVGVKLGDRMFLDPTTGALGYHDPVRATTLVNWKILNLGPVTADPGAGTLVNVTGWQNIVTLQNPFPGTARCTISFSANMDAGLEPYSTVADPGASSGELQLVYSVDGQVTTVAVPGAWSGRRITRLGAFGTYESAYSDNWPQTFEFPVGYYNNLDFYLRWYSPTSDVALWAAYQVAARVDWVWQQAL